MEDLISIKRAIEIHTQLADSIEDFFRKKLLIMESQNKIICTDPIVIRNYYIKNDLLYVEYWRDKYFNVETLGMTEDEWYADDLRDESL